MFEEYTYEYILNEMLSRISDTLDKREGSVIYNALAPAAMAINEQYKKLSTLVSLIWPDTATGEYLDKFVNQFGIERNKATYAIKKGTFYDNENQLIDIEIGKRFSINGIIYAVYEKISDGIFQMQCKTSGIIGNSQYGNLLPIDYVQNLSVAELSDILVPGDEEETDEELRSRFYSSVNSVAFGGNIADYKEKVKSIDGVGAVKVIPTWNGGGTVKLIVLDSSLNVPSETLLQNIQNAVGEDGDGIAPIGHIVTTVSATKVDLSISTDITLAENVAEETIKTAIENAINEYLYEVKENWGNSTSLTVRIAHIESRILNVEGVIDIANTKINNNTDNIILTNEQIPYLSEVVFNE